MKAKNSIQISNKEYKYWQQQLSAELKDINHRIDYLLEIFREEFGPFKPYK